MLSVLLRKLAVLIVRLGFLEAESAAVFQHVSIARLSLSNAL